jgi:hypothetical protein
MDDWFEVIVEGRHEAVRGFIAGFELASGHRQPVVFGRDLPLAPGSFHERLAELFERGTHTLLFGPRDAATALARALGERGTDVGLRVDGLRRLTDTRFAFRAEAFSREIADRIRGAMLGDLPSGVEVVDVEDSEEVDERARGQELYTPEHAFVFRLSATCRGSFPGVLEMHRRARAIEFVEPGDIDITAERVRCP